MKKKFIFIIICFIVFITVFFLVFFNIKKNSTTEGSLNRSISLSLNQMVKIKDENLKIKLLSITDSRCPRNAQCIWEGEISYDLLVNNNMYNLGTVKNRYIEIDNYIIKLNDNSNLKYIVINVKKKER